MDLLVTFSLALAAASLGAMLFFSLGIAPVIFRVLEPEPAGRFVRALFPVYYASGAAATALAGLLVIDAYAGWFLLAVAGIFLWLRQGLMPAINRARDRHVEGDAQAGRRFDRLHRLSVLVNVGQLALLVVVIFLLVSSTARGPA